MKVMRKSKSLVQPVLAYLYEGLSSFISGSNFFGSPYLLQGWLEGHFKGTALEPAAGAQWPIPRSIKKMSFEWRKFFDTIAEDDIISDMTKISTYVASGREERELFLIGAWFFVVYSIRRCSRMLWNFCIPPPVSFYRRVDYRVLNSKDDLLRLKETLLNWEFNGLD